MPLSLIRDYLTYQGMKYIKPEKAGIRADEMKQIKALGQTARKSFTELIARVVKQIEPFSAGRTSNWANQAQVLRPHFWVYLQALEDKKDEVGIAYRLYGTPDDWGISVEVSFVERYKSYNTLASQRKVLELPATAPLYYFVQVNGISHKEVATEENRQRLKKELAAGLVRKVLVKLDIPITETTTDGDLVQDLVAGFQKVYPYYAITKKT